MINALAWGRFQQRVAALPKGDQCVGMVYDHLCNLQLNSHTMDVHPTTNLFVSSTPNDTLAERLRRRPAKPMGSPCVGSNPTGVVSFCVIGILQKSIEAPDVIDA